MKRCVFIIIALLIFGSTAYPAQDARPGYKDFLLGMSREDIKGTIAAKYSGKMAKHFKDGDILLTVDDMTIATLFFDHTGRLFKILVQMKYGDITQIKTRLIDKYGQPNDYGKEEYNEGDKMYLMGRWLVDGKLQIMLWESFYCRNQRMMPCVVEVVYIDKERKEKKDIFERDEKNKEQKKKDDKIYDGF
jgi:hypothetical protein